MAKRGNKYGTKLKLPEIRQMAYMQYCEWIASGKPRKAWSFEHPQYTCSYRTMDKYIIEHPDEFLPIHKEIAHCKAYAKWFDEGVEMMKGKKEKCQPAIYQMVMRNMFDWDKENSSEKETTQPLIKMIAKKWRERSD
ncbi:MAG: hypothetical protein ACLFUW_00355 [Bacteroidales bacterium]